MNKIARSNRGKNVLSVQFAHERARQARGGLNENAFKRLGLEQSASKQRLLERLEAERIRSGHSEIANLGRWAEPFIVPAPMIWGLVILRQTFVRRSRNCVAWAATAGRPHPRPETN